jgi:hypothetical protein
MDERPPLLQRMEEQLLKFVGGEIEMVNRREGYRYRARIATLKIDDQGDLVLTFSWAAQAVDEKGERSYSPTGGWVEEPNLDYRFSMFLEPAPDMGQPDWVLFVGIGPTHGGGVVLRVLFYDETPILFPPGVSQLDPTQVRWLADGPRARFDAAQSTDDKPQQ